MFLLDAIRSVQWLWNSPGRNPEHGGTVKPVNIEVPEEAKPRNVSYIIYFIWFPLLILFPMALKNTGLIDHALIHGTLT